MDEREHLLPPEQSLITFLTVLRSLTSDKPVRLQIKVPPNDKIGAEVIRVNFESYIQWHLDNFEMPWPDNLEVVTVE